MLTGPTLRLCPGDLLNLRLENDLPPEPPMKESAMHGPRRSGAPMGHIPPHGFNTTNLHTHGLHVSPAGNSDNVFLEIAPGQRFPYETKIPRTHHPGTFWYHAHKHGSVALQLASGMAGALIVEGGLDDVPAIRCARERIMVFQQISYDKNGEVEADYYDDNAPPRTNVTTINGRLLPEIHMRPCEVQRWRLIHAGIETDLKLGLDQHKLNEIACDGIALGRMIPRDLVDLYPGYRSDVLIQASQCPGRYLLQNAPTSAERALNQIARDSPVPLAVVVVAGPPLPMCFPTPEELKPLAPLKPIDDVTGPVVDIAFDFLGGWGSVNGVEFDPTGGNVLPLKLGQAQEWHVHSVHGAPHPFHIHVNPFEVITRDAQGNIIDRVWRDTIAVLKAPQGDISLRIRYDKYIGRAVLHCHNLKHEDKGMMQTIDIEP